MGWVKGSFFFWLVFAQAITPKGKVRYFNTQLFFFFFFFSSYSYPFFF